MAVVGHFGSLLLLRSWDNARTDAGAPRLTNDGTVFGLGASKDMTTGNGRAILRRAFRQLEHEVPGKVARVLRSLRHPDSRWVRIPVGILLMLGGVFSILPFLGLWMLPLGLLLIAYDVPFLRAPVGRFTIWGVRKWAALRQRFFPNSPQA
jgi:hypothetical protein